MAMVSYRSSSIICSSAAEGPFFELREHAQFDHLELVENERSLERRHLMREDGLCLTADSILIPNFEKRWRCFEIYF